MVYHKLFYTRVWNILWYTINFAMNFWGKCIILGEYNIGRIQYWRMQYWANAILGKCNIGRIQYWANTILGECDSPLQLSIYWANAIRPYNYPSISVGAYRIRPFAYAPLHTPIYIHPKLHYYNITCNVFWVGSLVWLSHQNINSLPNNYPLKKSPCPTVSLGHGGLDV